MIHILYDGDILLRAMFATKLPPHVAVQTMLKIKNREKALIPLRTQRFLHFYSE